VSTWIAWSILLPVIYLYGRFVKACTFGRVPDFSLKFSKIPVYLNAPLLGPNKAPTPQKQWPLVIFSHGLGGSSTAYRHEELFLPFNIEMGQERLVDATYGKDDKDALMPLRRDQLVIRHYEIYTAFDRFSKFVRKQADPGLVVESDKGFKADSWTDNGD
ncbi:hypothetical protein MPER_03200, partial [Moniliophthora perniciosa FA553]